MNQIPIDSESTVIRVRIDKIGWRGEGLVRIESGWVVVPGALAGELVELRLHPKKHPKSPKIDATLLQVIEPAVERIPIDCELFPSCRGCHHRHVSADWEQEFKRRALTEILGKFGGWDRTVESVEAIGLKDTRETGYRMRGRLTVKDGIAGLNSPEGLQPMSQCHALTRDARDLVKAVQDCCPHDAEVHFIAPADGSPRIASDGDSASSAGLQACIGELIPGARWHAIGQATSEDQTTLRVHSHTFRASLDVWTHGSETTSGALYAWVQDYLATLAPGRLVELGCGIGGVTGLAISAGHSALGIDGSESAIEFARINVPEATFVASSFERGVRDLATLGRKFDYAVINPMREPVGSRVLMILEAMGVRQILYLAPSPQAGARDLGELRERGWNLAFAHMADLHPQTYHFMMVACVTRPAGG